jgi:hypothetical protein
MKARLSLSIDTDILKEVKKLSAKKNMSVSEMVEDYFKIITKPKRKLLTEILDELPKPNLPEDFDWKEEYIKDKMKKYGY